MRTIGVLTVLVVAMALVLAANSYAGLPIQLQDWFKTAINPGAIQIVSVSQPEMTTTVKLLKYSPERLPAAGQSLWQVAITFYEAKGEAFTQLKEDEFLYNDYDTALADYEKLKALIAK